MVSRSVISIHGQNNERRRVRRNGDDIDVRLHGSSMQLETRAKVQTKEQRASCMPTTAVTKYGRANAA